jgi:hypothetical protein
MCEPRVVAPGDGERAHSRESRCEARTVEGLVTIVILRGPARVGDGLVH